MSLVDLAWYLGSSVMPLTTKLWILSLNPFEFSLSLLIDGYRCVRYVIKSIAITDWWLPIFYEKLGISSFIFLNRTVRGPLLLVYKACTLLVGNQAWLGFVITAILLSYLLTRKLNSSSKYSIASTLHCKRGLQLFFQSILVL